jgi:cytochrome c-type biogenesis protein
MNEWLTAFTLGNAAILTNACLLPLYPGLLAFLAGTTNRENPPSASAPRAALGIIVLAGILTMMIFIGAVLYFLQQSFAAVLPVLLPLVYGVVIVFGLMMLTGSNPFARLSTVQAPMLRNPYATAYLYGLLFGPMTLPCVGPLITAAFAVGSVSGAGALVDGILYFLFFGLGFGWPLVVLPLIAMPVQRRLVGWLAHHHTLINRASGILLIAVGVFGILTELLPNYVSGIEVPPTVWWIYWTMVAVLIIIVGVFDLRAERDQ